MQGRKDLRFLFKKPRAWQRGHGRFCAAGVSHDLLWHLRECESTCVELCVAIVINLCTRAELYDLVVKPTPKSTLKPRHVGAHLTSPYEVTHRKISPLDSKVLALLVLTPAYRHICQATSAAGVSRKISAYMLTPTVANRLNWLYAAGNTPATSLTRSIPHGQDADILTLGCGDLRNILFTAYVERGLGKLHFLPYSFQSPVFVRRLERRTLADSDSVARKLDITCCDYDERIIGV